MTPPLPARSHRLRWVGRWKIEMICAAGIATASLVAAFVLLPHFHDFFFVWDHNFGPAVSVACGHELAEIEDAVPTLDDFLHRRRGDFDCSSIPPTVRLGPLNAYAEGIPYFLEALGRYWRLTGVSWIALAPLFGALFALSNTLIFFLFRQFLGNTLGVVFSLAYAISPSHYYALTYYEHYAKTPIFLASVLLMIWLVRRRVSSRQLLSASAAGGVLIGFGFGIRADLWLLAPLFAAAVLFFVSPAIGRRARMLSCAVFLCVGTVVALPALRAQGSSYFWLQLLQGLSTPFDADLHVQPAIYEWMPQYSDNLGVNWMQTHAFYRIDGGTTADADTLTGRGGERAGIMTWQAREAAGRAGYLAIMRHFPADFVTRPLAAVLEVAGQSFRSQPASARQFGTAPNFFTRTLPLWSFLASVSAFPIFVLAVALFGMAAGNKREAFFFLLAILYLGGMTAIVFLPRHRWHLYFIGFLAAGLAVRFTLDHVMTPLATLHRAGRVVGGALPATLLVCAFAGAVVVLPRAYQDRNVGQLVEQLLAAEREPVRLQRAGSTSILEAPDLIERFGAHAAAIDHFQYGDYLMATFARDRCGAATQAKALYSASQPFFDDTRTFALDFSHESSSFRFVFPAYNMKLGANFGYFRGFELAGAPEGCFTQLIRFRNPAALPFLITWYLPERWELAPRHQRMVFAAP
jgi:hypothetical protein